MTVAVYSIYIVNSLVKVVIIYLVFFYLFINVVSLCWECAICIDLNRVHLVVMDVNASLYFLNISMNLPRFI